MKITSGFAALAVVLATLVSASYAADTGAGDETLPPGLEMDGAQAGPQVPDPLEPFNRAMFQFNDKLYFWVLKPVAQGYSKILPEMTRKGVGNFFSNLESPVRVVNSALQGKFEDSGAALARFLVNTTAGGLGFTDPAAKKFDVPPPNEDLGQTLGSYGMGEMFYIVWPVLGPSNVRDTIGMVGDGFLDPLYYAEMKTWEEVALKAGDRINALSMRLGEYEQFKQDALDPYVSMRDGYLQRRRHLVEDREPGAPGPEGSEK
ncbi:VacJ family lipoprotein [Kiritimatiella glycovorans]|uniref:Putative phospholipid-binding lipoprotein MlaA n=1 Tax=Kiritimatiella glycovorans TaxID=1307763 RepID=A0A0G3EAG7_9BACT|nr:VacJ family lipoprotein [Kiritimatiella glycovorans]AKJ63436.1 putative phospholipid-binding lipoprotein MlaA precursor [Kiritimatiella glycovorans]